MTALAIVVLTSTMQRASAEDHLKWNYQPELLRPFWVGDTMEGESVLFIEAEQGGEARASVLFPITEVLSVKNSAGDITYQPGTDYIVTPNSREIVLPAGSRIPSFSPSQLRRPAKSQQYQLTHRDGNGEIYFGGRLEYAEMQTCVTYRHAEGLWSDPLPKFDKTVLPKSINKLRSKSPLSIVVLGDSISAGANASGLFDSAPFQPPYPKLLEIDLASRTGSPVSVTNISVGGKDTAWGTTMTADTIAPQPDLVVIAFGMNDSAGRSAEEYQVNTKRIMENVRAERPECEFILVATMLGNRDWITLKHEAFPQYREKLLELSGPGIAVADLTSIWSGFLKVKQDWDQTGNGVNHPNDWGHRVYAQVIAELLIPSHDDAPGRE